MNTSTAQAETVHSQAIENENAKVRIVAKDDGRNRKPVQISLSENQLTSLDNAANEAGMNRSEFVRSLLQKAIKNFPDDLSGVGQYDRSKD